LCDSFFRFVFAEFKMMMLTLSKQRYVFEWVMQHVWALHIEVLEWWWLFVVHLLSSC
jgi:hypothetical protein